MDTIFMEKAIKLSHLGRGFVNPNPIVGSVIVKNNSIVGEGYHKFYGGSHSEVMAIEDQEKKPEEVLCMSPWNLAVIMGKHLPVQIKLLSLA